MRKKPVGILKKGRSQQRSASASKKSLKKAPKKQSGTGSLSLLGTERKSGSRHFTESASLDTGREAAVGSQLAQEEGDTAIKERETDAEVLQEGSAPAKKQQPGKQWTCCSIVDKQAAQAVRTLLDASEKGRKGATMKGLTLAPHIQAKKATFKVTCETLRLLPQIKQALKETGLLQQHRYQSFMLHSTSLDSWP